MKNRDNTRTNLVCDIMRSLQDFNSVMLWIHQRIVVDGILSPLLVNGDSNNQLTGTGYFMVIINGSQAFDCPTAVPWSFDQLSSHSGVRSITSDDVVCINLKYLVIISKAI